MAASAPQPQAPQAPPAGSRLRPRPDETGGPAAQSGAARVIVETPGFTWIDLDDPRAPELDELASRFGFHELAVEDCRNHPQLAKLDPFPEHAFLIANTIRYDNERDELSVREVDVFLGSRFLVTVHEGPSRAVETVAAQIEAGAGPVTPTHVLYILLDTMVDRFMPTLDAVGETIDEVEDVVMERLDKACLHKIFKLRRNLVAFRRAAAAQRELLNTLARREPGLVPAEMAIYFRDIYDHVVASIEMIESYRDLLSGILEIYLTQTANRTNDIVKAVTIIATIILPLTLVTGWYGMNVVELPFADDPNGIWYISGAMGLVILGFLVFFKRKGWI